MSDGWIHWGGPLIPSLCGSLSTNRYTTVRYVTCHYCMNIIDRCLHEHPPREFARSLESADPMRTRQPPGDDKGKGEG